MRFWPTTRGVSRDAKTTDFMRALTRPFVRTRFWSCCPDHQLEYASYFRKRKLDPLLVVCPVTTGKTPIPYSASKRGQT